MQTRKNQGLFGKGLNLLIYLAFLLLNYYRNEEIWKDLYIYSEDTAKKAQVDLKFVVAIQPFPKRGILDSSKLKEFADDNFIFDENGRKFSKQVENTVGKEVYLFSPFPTVFSNDLQGLKLTSFATGKKLRVP